MFVGLVVNRLEYVDVRVDLEVPPLLPLVSGLVDREVSRLPYSVVAHDSSVHSRFARGTHPVLRTAILGCNGLEGLQIGV